jgi:transposase
MITGAEEMEANALRARGWSISAIARHLDRDRHTVRDYLNGKRVPGVRRRQGTDPFDAYQPYVAQRLIDDPHVWASALYDEVVALGYPLSYPRLTAAIRDRRLRPHCEACAGVKGRATIEIEHPPAEENQWDWDELPEAPWGGDAHLLIGSLPCSGKFRGRFATSEDQPHLIEAMDAILRALGGTAHTWRFDRMSTVVNPATGIVQPSFVPVAKHYNVNVVACPPRRGNRKGSVEKSIHFATQRFWRTTTAASIPEANAALDRFCERIADQRPRPIDKLDKLLGEDRARAFLEAVGRTRPTVSDLAGFEKLRGLPTSPYPARKEESHPVRSSALVAFEGNFYSVPPGFIGTQVTVSHRLGSPSVDVVAPSGVIICRHERATTGTGKIVRALEHKAALESEVLSAFRTDPPCKRKLNKPPSPAARAEAAKLLESFEDADVVVDLAVYQSLVEEAGFGGERSAR